MKPFKKDVFTDLSGNLKDEEGYTITPPKHWSFLPAGDAGLTRKVSSKGEYWRVVFKKGRRTMSKGIWAPTHTIISAKEEIATMRSSKEYQKKRLYDIERRSKKQREYELAFCLEVEKFLNFHYKYHDVAKALAILVTQHAVPIGSGTVARTQTIPLNERASRAVIAWMRHQTTAYDHMNIAHKKGERRSIRRELAKESIKILENYRNGAAISTHCPLKLALENNIRKKGK